jgi:hypothetical protein
MDTVDVALGLTALGIGVLLAKQGPKTVNGPSGFVEKTINAGRVSPESTSRDLAMRAYQAGGGFFAPQDIPALTRAIEEAPVKTGKVFPHYDPHSGMMRDIGYRVHDGQRTPLSYIYYPVGGHQSQGTMRPIL